MEANFAYLQQLLSLCATSGDNDFHITLPQNSSRSEAHNLVSLLNVFHEIICLSQVTGGLSSISQATHSAAGAVVSKPREFASLIRNKFGSADNISALKDSLDEQQGDESVTSAGTAGTRTLGPGQLQSSPKYGSEDDCSSATSGSAGANSTTGAPGGPPSSKGNTLDHAQSSGFDALLHEIQELKDNQSRLEESFENLKSHYQRDYTEIMQALQEERYRYMLL